MSLQFRIQGHTKNTELVLNPQGPYAPTSFKNDSRRANDGNIYFGQNKFGENGIQINDFVIEYNMNAVQGKGI